MAKTYALLVADTVVTQPGGAPAEVLTAPACPKAWTDVAYYFKVSVCQSHPQQSPLRATLSKLHTPSTYRATKKSWCHMSCFCKDDASLLLLATDNMCFCMGAYGLQLLVTLWQKCCILRPHQHFKQCNTQKHNCGLKHDRGLAESLVGSWLPKDARTLHCLVFTWARPCLSSLYGDSQVKVDDSALCCCRMGRRLKPRTPRHQQTMNQMAS